MEKQITPQTITSRLLDEERSRFMRMMNNRTTYKDPTVQNLESIGNGISIQPFKSLTSYHLWIRRNILPLPDRNSIIYISGMNLIIENTKTKIQQLIKLKNKGNVTSLFISYSSMNETLIFVGEKIDKNEDTPYMSGGCEIINLDGKILPKHIVFDLASYQTRDSYVQDVISPIENDLCIITLRVLDKKKHNYQLQFWNFLTMNLLDIESFDFQIESIVGYGKKSNSYLIFGPKNCALYEFDESKKQLIMLNDFLKKKNHDFDISNAGFIRSQGKDGVIIAYNNEWFEIYMKANDNLVSSENNNSFTHTSYLNTQNIDTDKYKLYLRMDYFSMLKSDKININESSELPEDFTDCKENFSEEESDFLQINSCLGAEEINLSSKKNSIKYIISREDFIFLFIKRSNIVIILEFIDDNKVRLCKVELLPYKLLDLSSVAINKKMTKMLLCNGDPCFKFYKLLSQNRDKLSSQDDGSKENSFSLTNVTMSYYEFNIELFDNKPTFMMNEILMPNSGIGFPVKGLCLSSSPSILMINNGSDGTELYFYIQRTKGDLNTYLKSKGYEGGSQNYINLRREFYREYNDFEFFVHKKFEEKPINICFDPMGKALFVTYKDCGYYYVIIEKELKEMFKVTMYCRGCTFDPSGTYLAFGTSEFDNEYTINILNVATYEYEYMITKVPPPKKMVFCDGARILLALFDDNSTNILGWKLDWNNRLIENSIGNAKDKPVERSNENNIMKVTDFSGYVLDFAYDQVIEHCIISSNDKRIRVYQGSDDDEKWEFQSDVSYPVITIVKKYDSVIFGTEKGCLRVCLWPIQNLLKDSNVDHPEYTELNLHTARITCVIVSSNYEFVYSSSEDGSVYVSCLNPVMNGAPLNLTSFYYFSNRNVLPKKLYYDNNDISFITDAVYQNKISTLKKKKTAIQSKISEFQSEKEKLLQGNTNKLDKERADLTEQLEEIVKLVKEKENEKEKETKRLKDEREFQLKLLKDELNAMKKDFKIKKEDKQIETTKLINCIKVAKEKFEAKKAEIESLKAKTNNNIANCLDNMFQILQEKKTEIDKMIKEKEKKFKADCEKNEELYETDLRKKEDDFKQSLEDFEDKIKEKDNEISKKNKDNKNYDEKINEWENHLKELKINNEELMETYIFNTLKLNQMNQLLTDNENKISMKEKIVKDKRLINDRLEQLRFVLEYQIKNLILEKTPIEEQIKNFESLHSDFYKRFNLLYTELLNISDLIDNNQKCIDTYRDELSQTKKSLYQLKNLYKSIDVALNSILKNKLDTKKDIIDQIFNVYQQYLYNFDYNNKQTKIVSAEMKLQTKNIEKEIYNQKNNVLKELIEKRSERRKILNEKDEMMKDIRLDNQLLIQECSNIRENLEDILKNINDIEKKFIELTNNNNFLGGKENQNEIMNIKGKLKEAKEHVLLNDADKIRVGKTSAPVDLPSIKLTKNPPTSGSINAEELLKKHKKNTEKIKKEKADVEKLHQQLKDLVGENNSTNKINFASSLNTSGKKSSIPMLRAEDGRILSIKTGKYYDIKEQNIKK